MSPPRKKILLVVSRCTKGIVVYWCNCRKSASAGNIELKPRPTIKLGNSQVSRTPPSLSLSLSIPHSLDAWGAPILVHFGLGQPNRSVPLPPPVILISASARGSHHRLAPTCTERDWDSLDGLVFARVDLELRVERHVEQTDLRRHQVRHGHVHQLIVTDVEHLPPPHTQHSSDHTRRAAVLPALRTAKRPHSFSGYFPGQHG